MFNLPDGRLKRNTEKNQVFHGEEVRLRVVKMPHALPLMYSVNDRSLGCMKQVVGNFSLQVLRFSKACDIGDLNLELQSFIFTDRFN